MPESKNSPAMRRGVTMALIGTAIFMWAPHAALAEASSPGATLYQNNCASCHDHPESTRALPRDTMAQMPAATIIFALTEGKMKVQGATLSEADRNTLVGYITGGHGPISNKDEWSQGMMCAADRRVADLKGPATVSTFGYDLSNTRVLSARQAGLTKAQLSHLELAWAIAIPGGTTMRSQPAIVGKTVFMPAPDAGAVYAIDVSEPGKPCIKWIYRTQGNAPLRTSVAYGVLADGTGALAVAGFDTTIHLLDAKTGNAIWTKKTGTYSYSLTTGTPVVLADRIIVPMSQYEIAVAARNDQVCCNNHGYVLSLSPKDGSQQWRYDTMPDATPIRDRGDGKMLYGPSGAPIWNSPAIDQKRRLIYFGTGEANSPPTHKNTDAIIAIGLDDGKERWSHAGLPARFGTGPGPGLPPVGPASPDRDGALVLRLTQRRANPGKRQSGGSTARRTGAGRAGRYRRAPRCRARRPAPPTGPRPGPTQKVKPTVRSYSRPLSLRGGLTVTRSLWRSQYGSLGTCLAALLDPDVHIPAARHVVLDQRGGQVHVEPVPQVAHRAAAAAVPQAQPGRPG